MTHLTIAPILLPALLAALMVMARQNLSLQRALSGLGVAALSVFAGLLLLQTTTAPQAYFLGNWPAPFGIALLADRLSALMLALTAALAVLVWIHSIATGWDARGAQFHPLFMFQLMGLNGAFLTADAFNLFVFFEVLLIASYGLMVHSGGAERLRAGLQYVAFNLLGSALFLIALASIYALTGTLNMADLAAKLPLLPASDAALIRATAVLLMLVFAIKAALVPLHLWLPATYANAPPPVAALFAIMTKVGAYALIRFGTLIFPLDLPATTTLIQSLLQPAAMATIILGAIGSLGARNLPRLIGFAAIGSMGVLLLAVADFTPQATAAALYYMAHSTLAMAALFLLSDAIPVRRNELSAALFMACAIAMAGLPPLSGFLGKLMILDALRATAPLSWTIILISALLTMIAFARMGSDMFWKDPAANTAPNKALLAPALCLSAMIALTVCAGPVIYWLTQAAADLFDPAASIAAIALQEQG